MGPTPLHVVRRVPPGFLAVMPHPGSGPQLGVDLAYLRDSSVAVLVSLLEPGERKALGLTDTARLCKELGIEYLSHPVADMTPPGDSQAFAALALKLANRMLDGAGIAIHCRAGIGRSGLLAASVLVACGATPADAFDEVSTARGASVPEVPAQGRWLEHHRQLLIRD